MVKEGRPEGDRESVGRHGLGETATSDCAEPLDCVGRVAMQRLCPFIAEATVRPSPWANGRTCDPGNSHTVTSWVRPARVLGLEPVGKLATSGLDLLIRDGSSLGGRGRLPVRGVSEKGGHRPTLSLTTQASCPRLPPSGTSTEGATAPLQTSRREGWAAEGPTMPWDGAGAGIEDT